MAPQTELDPISVLITVFTALVGPQLAPVASAYMIIFLGALVGLMIGLRRRAPTSKLGVAGYSFVTVVTAIVMSVWMSQLLSSYLPKTGDVTGNWLYFPIAMTTTAYGEIWMAQLKTIVSRMPNPFKKGP